MKKDTLAIRINRTNPNHHIYNNNGTWWCHYTRCPTPITAERVRLSLGTKSLSEARKRRDILLGLYDPLTDFPYIAGRKKQQRVVTDAPTTFRVAAPAASA